MGLLTNLFISIINLIFVAMDILLLMILAKIIYQKWRPSWLEQIFNAIEPLVSYVLDYFQKLISRITGKTYSKRISLNVLFFCLWITRLVVAGLL
jgi:uncharacterized protein YggT (Ycf19 family)